MLARRCSELAALVVVRLGVTKNRYMRTNSGRATAINQIKTTSACETRHLYYSSLSALLLFLLFVQLFRLLALRWGFVRACSVFVCRSSLVLLVLSLLFVGLLIACVIVPGQERKQRSTFEVICLFQGPQLKLSNQRKT